MTVQSHLVYDVGVGHGDDSAYYLHKGYRVVGVEANPFLLPGLRKRFEREIRDGRYELVPCAVAEREGDAEYWICEDVPGWSSVDRAIASYSGSRHHRASVKACRFESIIERFGVPYYCKIDIEGSDELCLDGFARTACPKYLSIEIPLIGTGVVRGRRGERLIRRLQDLGYARFKIISQVTFRQPSARLARLKARLPRRASRHVTALQERLFRLSQDDWTFPDEASGPFGEETPGSWLEAPAAVELSRAVEANDDISDWFDIHAALDSSRERSGD